MTMIIHVPETSNDYKLVLTSINKKAVLSQRTAQCALYNIHII